MKTGNFLNRLALSASYILKKPALPLFPQEASIEITNRCNLTCRMCPHVKMTRDKGVMDYNLFCKIIEQLKGKTEFVYLYGTGESLLVSDFFKYAHYAVKSGMTTCLSTNVTMLKDDSTEMLIDSKIDFIVLAVDGSTEETYGNIRIGADFTSTISKCKKLLQAKIRKKSTVDITIQFIVMKENETEAQSIKTLFSKEEQNAINHFRLKPLYETYAGSPGNEIIHTHPCYFLWNFISITWDGKVQICCMDYDASHVLGDVTLNSIADIWNAEKIRSLREKHLALQHDTIPICKNCSLSEKSYFSTITVLGSAFVNSWRRRKITPYFEKYYVLKKTRR